MVTGGLIVHPIDAAGDMLRFYRDAVADCPDDLTVFAAVVHAPDGSGTKIGGMVVFHTGDPGQAERDLAPFKSWGSPLMVEVGPMPYPVMNTLLDDAYPAGSLNYWLSSFTTGLPDALIDTMLERFATVPSPMSAILLEHFHGAVTRVGPTETAVPHRDEGWNLLLPSVWVDPADTDANIAWTKDTFAALSEHFGGGRWLNYLGDDQDGAIRSALWPELRPARRRQATVRPRERLPPEPQHRPVAPGRSVLPTGELGLLGRGLLVLGEPPLEDGPGDDADEAAVVDDRDALRVLRLDEPECLVEGGVGVDRVVGRLGELPHGRGRRVAPLRHHPGDERLAGHHPDERPVGVDDVHRAHLGRGQHLTGLAGGGCRGERAGLGDHRVADAGRRLVAHG